MRLMKKNARICVFLENTSSVAPAPHISKIIAKHYWNKQAHNMRQLNGEDPQTSA